MPHESAKTIYFEVSEMIDKLTLVYNNQSSISSNDLIKYMTTLLGHWQCSHHSFPVTGPSDVTYMMQQLTQGLQNSSQAKIGRDTIDHGIMMNDVIDQLLYIYAAYGFTMTQEARDALRRSTKH